MVPVSQARRSLNPGAPLLRELNCSGCSALFRLDLAANCQLTRLDISGCNRLRQLTVTSPNLTGLSARGCRSLVELRLDSQQVEQLLLNNCRALQEVVSALVICMLFRWSLCSVKDMHACQRVK
jgi:hypothetical protein